MHTLLPRTLPVPSVLAAGAVLALLLLAAGGAATARPVQAVSPITVNTLDDGHNTSATNCLAGDGKCTLRAAIEFNEAHGGGSAITLTVPGTINLTLGQLIITKNVAISGAGAGTDTVAGNGKERVFGIGPTAVVTLSGFTITGGRATTGPDIDAGGGIANFGRLTLANVNVQGNATDAEGGGIADFGTLNSTGGAFTSNTAGGGIGAGVGGNVLIGVFLNASFEVVARGTATFAGATIANGHAQFGGGAAVLAGTATFTQTTFAGNEAALAAGVGGGGAIASICGGLTLVNDTLNGNQARNVPGGGIFQECGRITPSGGPVAAWPLHHAFSSQLGPFVASVTPSPISLPNGSPTPVPARADTALDFVTIAGNTAVTSPGIRASASVDNLGDSSTIELRDTIVANKAGGANCLTESGASIVSQGYNLEDANDCGLARTGDQTGVDPKLGALATNGGPTQTMALAAGSPAVDTADPQCDVKTDQRGVSRPQGPRCDIGAFELQSSASATPTPATPTPLPSPPVTGQGPAGTDPSLIALILAVLALPVVGAGLLIARGRTA